MLEQQVVHLERHLLSLYRKTFDQQISSESSVAGRLPLITIKVVSAEVSGRDVTPENDNTVTRSNDLLSPRHSAGNPLKECNGILEQQKIVGFKHSSLLLLIVSAFNLFNKSFSSNKY